MGKISRTRQQAFSTIPDEKSPEALDRLAFFCLWPLNNSERRVVKLNLQSSLDFGFTLWDCLPIVYKDKKENVTGSYVRMRGESRTARTRAVRTEVIKKTDGKAKVGNKWNTDVPAKQQEQVASLTMLKMLVISASMLETMLAFSCVIWCHSLKRKTPYANGNFN